MNYFDFNLWTNHFETGLDALKQKLLMMASHAETAVNESVQSLMQRDLTLALRVKADDDVIDQFEVEIDEMAIQLLTKAPLASNLRLVTVAMKVSQNLERIGDEVNKIAKRARDPAQEPPVKINPTCRTWPAWRWRWSRPRLMLSTAIPPPPAPSSRATRKWMR